MHTFPLLFWTLFALLDGLACASGPQELSPSETQDLCSYIKDVEAADCIQDTWAELKAREPAAYGQRLEIARKRKAEVHRVYEALRASPAATTPGQEPTRGSALELQPPINERTLVVWIGPPAKGAYANWLQAQCRALEQEARQTDSPERRKEIEAALAINWQRLEGLQRIKDPAQLNCFLGEGCEKKPDVPVSTHQSAPATTGEAWTTTDFKRANQQETERQVRLPIGRLGGGVPDLGTVASGVFDNSPLGPLRDGDHDAPLNAVATVAFATTGALLLFGGLGGKILEEKLPNIRRNMGIAAGISGLVAVGAVSLPTLTAAPAATAPPAAASAVPKLALAGGGYIEAGAGGLSISQAVWRTVALAGGVLGLKTVADHRADAPGPEVSMAQAASNSQSVAATSERQDEDRRQAEYERARDYCGSQPPEGDNECSTLSRKIDHAKRCIELYEAWDARWKPGDHVNKINSFQNRLRNLKEEHQRKCAQT